MQWENFESVSKIETMTKIYFSSLLFNIIMVVSARSIKQTKNIKETQIRKQYVGAREMPQNLKVFAALLED